MGTLLLAWQLLLAMGGVSLESLSVGGAPLDVATEWKAVRLREALTSNTGQPRLILYLRDIERVGLDRERVVEQLPWIFPLDSVQAEVAARDGTRYTLRLTDYSFFRGMPGLVLTGTGMARGTSFYRLRLRSRTPIPSAVMVWLDSLGRSRPD